MPPTIVMTGGSALLDERPRDRLELDDLDGPEEREDCRPRPIGESLWPLRPIESSP
ncbi:hypothetical protein BH23ACT11_BH23ACT11_07700 [soil metagenome]